jgi:lysophospholipase L1-like esterase
LAKNGRSSSSFRAEGLWDKVTSLLQDRPAFQASYVLIQFGHNDQPGKPGRSTDLVTEFPVNMTRFVSEVTALGGIPVLVTPLTRRSFRNHILHDDLQPWAQATRDVARAQHVALLELNADSAAAVQAMGELEADTLAVEPPAAKVPSKAQGDLNQIETTSSARSAFDHTHVGPKGAAFFANIVAQELMQALPAIRASFKSGK